MAENQPEFKYIVRVINTDLDGNKPILHALHKIKGISFMYANMICSFAQLDKKKKAGNLTDVEVKKLEEVMRNPLSFKAPVWMLNRRFDFEDGENKHLIGTDLIYSHENDIKLLRKIKSYKGLRHGLGLPVRGQRTKSNFRKNKGKVQGVMKKSSTPAKK